MIRECSYVFTYEFKDTFCNKEFVFEQSKNYLNEKKIERFKQEFVLKIQEQVSHLSKNKYETYRCQSVPEKCVSKFHRN